MTTNNEIKNNNSKLVHVSSGFFVLVVELSTTQNRNGLVIQDCFFLKKKKLEEIKQFHINKRINYFALSYWWTLLICFCVLQRTCRIGLRRIRMPVRVSTWRRWFDWYRDSVERPARLRSASSRASASLRRAPRAHSRNVWRSFLSTQTSPSRLFCVAAFWAKKTQIKYSIGT